MTCPSIMGGTCVFVAKKMVDAGGLMLVSCWGKRIKKNVKIFVFGVGVGADLIEFSPD